MSAAESARTTRMLDIHGLRIELSWPAALRLDQLAGEFTYFDSAERSPGAHCRVRLEQRRPDTEVFPFLRPAYYTPRNICYHHEGRKIVNYHGKALLTQSPDQSDVTVTSEDPDLLQAIAYTIVLYQSGRHLDRIGRFRVHALGFAYHGKAALVLLPIGGGKSTLLLELMRQPGVELIAEDTPLLAADGRLHPFPVKIGVLADQVPDDVPREFITRVRHLEGVEKDLIDLAYYQGRIAAQPRPLAAVFLGERFLGTGASIVPVSYWHAYKRFFRDCVVGLGVYQGLEFAITRSYGELFASTRTALRRASACARALRGVQLYEFQMGIEPRRNAERLLEALRR